MWRLTQSLGILALLAYLPSSVTFAADEQASVSRSSIEMEIGSKFINEFLGVVAGQTYDINGGAQSIHLSQIEAELKRESPRIRLSGELNVDGLVIPTIGLATLRVDITGPSSASISLRDVDLSPAYTRIPWTDFKVLWAATLFDVTSDSITQLAELSLPLDLTQGLTIPPQEIRERGRLGDADVDFVFDVGAIASTLAGFRISEAIVIDDAVRVVLSADLPQIASSKRSEDTQGRPDRIVLRIGGDALARAMTTGAVQANVRVENISGWVAGREMGNIPHLRAVWFVEVDAKEPLKGQISFDPKVSWSDGRLNFQIQGRAFATGGLHAHYDPGPGGGCGDRTGASLRSEVSLDGQILFSSAEANALAYEVLLAPKPASFHYEVGSINICGHRKGSISADLPFPIRGGRIQAGTIPLVFRGQETLTISGRRLYTEWQLQGIDLKPQIDGLILEVSGMIRRLEPPEVSVRQ